MSGAHPRVGLIVGTRSQPSGCTGTIRCMTEASTTTNPCLFCAIAAREAEASIVYEDEMVVAFMDLNPVTPGHLLVVPREHAVGLDDLDISTGAQVWSTGQLMGRALRRSGLRCEGVNLFVADGEAAFQEIFHFHLHVFPRYAGDGFTIDARWERRERSLLDAEAEAIRTAIPREE